MDTVVYIAQSIDGFIADKQGGIEWLNEIPNPTGSDYGFATFMAGVDAIAMGRKTFEQVCEFDPWPYSKPVFVISRTLHTLPESHREKATVLSMAPQEIVSHLKSQGIERLYVDGGTLIQSFLKEDLIDQLIITTVPIMLGSGISLFSERGLRSNWIHQGTDVINNALVKTNYVRAA